MAKQRVFVLEGDIRRVEKVCVTLLHAAGVELQSVNAGLMEDVASTDVPRMFQQAHGWACKQRGLVSALPTFLSEGQPQREDHRLALLTSDVAERIDATEQQLWPNEPLSRHDAGHFFRVVHDHGARQGFATAFPLFMSTEKDGQRVQHLVALKKPQGIPYDLELEDLAQRPFLDIRHTCARVNRWAVEQGYAAAVPSFHVRIWNRTWGERGPLALAEQDLNHLLWNEGWRVVRVDPLKLTASREGLAYLLEKD